MADLDYGFEVEDKVAPSINPKLEAMNANLEKTVGLLEKGTARAKEHGEKHEAGWRGVGKSIEEARNEMHEFFEFIGATVAFEVLEKIADKLIEIGEEAVKTAARTERIDLSFKNMIGTENAENFLGWLEKIGDHTEFTRMQLKGWSAELLKAGVKPEDADKFIAAGLDIAAKSANPGEAMSSAIAAFERASLTGRVSSRQLMSLGVGVDDLKALPQFHGMSDDAIRKSLQKGTIGLNEFLTVIAGADGKLGDLGIKASTTMEAQLTHLKALPERFMEGLAKTDAFDRLKDTLGKVLEALDPESPRGKRIAAHLETIANLLTRIMASDKLPALFERTADAVERIARGTVRIGDLFGVTKAEPGQGMGDLLHDVVHKAMTNVIPGYGAASSKAAGEAHGAAFGQGLVAGARDSVKAHSPSEAFAALGSDVAAGFELGLDRRSRNTSDAMGEMLMPGDAAARGGGDQHVTVDVGGVHVHSGGDHHADAEAVAEAVVGKIVHKLERVRAQQGA